MRVPRGSSVLNVSKAAQDQKKKNVSLLGLHGHLGFLTCWTPFDSYNFSPLQKQESPMLRKNKTKTRRFNILVCLRKNKDIIYPFAIAQSEIHFLLSAK
jgi:hypothetical protein